MNFILDGVLAVIDIDGNTRINEFNSKKAVTIINFRPSHVSLEIANTGTPIEEYQADLSSLCQTGIPRIDAYEVTDICASGFQPRSSDGEQYFSCINMDVIDKEMAFGSASIDFQGLKEDRSYVVVGGTKGLGLSTVKWMASRGIQFSGFSMEIFIFLGWNILKEKSRCVIYFPSEKFKFE